MKRRYVDEKEEEKRRQHQQTLENKAREERLRNKKNKKIIRYIPHKYCPICQEPMCKMTTGNLGTTIACSNPECDVDAVMYMQLVTK